MPGVALARVAERAFFLSVPGGLSNRVRRAGGRSANALAAASSTAPRLGARPAIVLKRVGFPQTFFGRGEPVPRQHRQGRFGERVLADDALCSPRTAIAGENELTRPVRLHRQAPQRRERAVTRPARVAALVEEVREDQSGGVIVGLSGEHRVEVVFRGHDSPVGRKHFAIRP